MKYLPTTLAGCRHILMIPSDFSTCTSSHSVLLVMMFNAHDVTKQPKNNKPEFLTNLFGERYLSWLSCDLKSFLKCPVPFLNSDSLEGFVKRWGL